MKHIKKLSGVVVSTKMQKTVVVEVSRLFKHRRYGKYVDRAKRYLAHNELADVAVGDKVVMVETRPQSRHKSFRVIAKL